MPMGFPFLVQEMETVMKHVDRVLVFGGPESGTCFRDLVGSEVFVGRFGPGQDGLDFSRDMRVSRQHAVLLRDQAGGWILEDVNSANGTDVDGYRIATRQPTSVKPGQVIQTGDSQWTIIPGEWLTAAHGPVVLYGPCARVISYVAYHCGKPIIPSLTAVNTGLDKSAAFNLTVEVDGFSYPTVFPVPELPPGIPVSVPLQDIHLRADEFRSKASVSRSPLMATTDGSSLSPAAMEVVVLGFWDWPQEEGSGALLPAFVCPVDQQVCSIALDAETALPRLSSSESFRGLLQSRTPRKHWIVLQAIYETLRDYYYISYTDPLQRIIDPSQAVYQTIRTPNQLFRQRSGGEGTCLDLALLVASCLERAEVCPVVILTWSDEPEADHALAGCWSSLPPNPDDLIWDRDYLLEAMQGDNLLIVESTGFSDACHPKLSFNDARFRAEERLRASSRACLVNISASRRYGNVPPLEDPLDATVVRVYEEAVNFATSRLRRRVQLTDLLYGMLVVSGPETVKLFDRAGYADRESLCRTIEEFEWHPSLRPGVKPVPGHNYMTSQYLAEQCSWRQPSRFVREKDVLWALLEQSPHSEAFIENCGKLGLDLNKLRQAFQVLHPELRFDDESSRRLPWTEAAGSEDTPNADRPPGLREALRRTWLP